MYLIWNYIYLGFLDQGLAAPLINILLVFPWQGWKRWTPLGTLLRIPSHLRCQQMSFPV